MTKRGEKQLFHGSMLTSHFFYYTDEHQQQLNLKKKNIFDLIHSFFGVSYPLPKRRLMTNP